jgi:uncharacterized membrane protein (DUF2068 family)
MPKSKTHSRGLMLIAAFKLLKGFALLAVAIGALRLLHRDVAGVADQWINAFRVDPHNHYIHWLLAKLANVDDRKLRELSVGTFIYAAVFLTEGTGLALSKRWAEYFTIITTSSFLPLEVYEIIHHATIAKVVALFINIAVVAYLVRELRRYRKAAPRHGIAPNARLQSTPGSGGGSPGPLKVETAEVAGDVDNLSDEK